MEAGMRPVSFAAAVCIAVLVVVLLSSLPTGTVAASLQGTAPRRGAQAKAADVGKVNFPTSCLQPAQSVMEKGLALLHSFQYDEAERAFANAARLDPRCALAYWVKAMALYQ